MPTVEALEIMKAFRLPVPKPGPSKLGGLIKILVSPAGYFQTWNSNLAGYLFVAWVFVNAHAKAWDPAGKNTDIAWLL